MEIKIFKKEEIIPGIWEGGKTWELFIWPPDKKYKNRDFDFRLSTASIEKSPSDFTRFEGYQRYLIMIDNDLNIIRNEEMEHYKKNEVFEFDSSDEIKSFSVGNDFNLMREGNTRLQKIKQRGYFYLFWRATTCMSYG